MKILVALKQVPALEEIRFQPGINRIVRDGVSGMLNPLDSCALSTALALRSAHGGDVVAVTMGPPNAREVLAEAIRFGVDRAVHLCDERLAGADSIATARALSLVYLKDRADVFLFGRTTIDGGTGQTPAQVAEFTGIPHLNAALDVWLEDGRVHTVRPVGSTREHWTAALPAVVSVQNGPSLRPASPSPGPAAAARGAIETWNIERLGGDEADYGIRGSATYVRMVSQAPARTNSQLAVQDAVVAVMDAARTAQAPGPVPTRPSPRKCAQGKELWAVAETGAQGLHPSSIESIACLEHVADALGAEVTAVLLTGPADPVPATLTSSGADRVLVARSPALTSYDADVYTEVMSDLIVQHHPLAVVAPWGAQGCDWLPRVAARLGLGLVGDFVALEVDPRPGAPNVLDLVWVKPAWAGTVHARVVARTVPALGALRPGAVRVMPPRPAVAIPVEELEVSSAPPVRRARLESVSCQPALHVPVETAGVVLCVGSRVDQRVAEHLHQTAKANRWAFACTSRAAQLFQLPRESELSIATNSIAPAVFVGFELDDVQDLAPVRSAGLVVTVESESRLPQSAADVTVIGDAAVFATALSAAAMRGRPDSG